MLEATDVYDSISGDWEPCPAPGFALQPGLAVTWVRPLRLPAPDLSQMITPEVLRGFRAMARALTASQAAHPDVRAACEWLAADSVPVGDQTAQALHVFPPSDRKAL